MRKQIIGERRVAYYFHGTSRDFPERAVGTHHRMTSFDRVL